MLCFGRGEDPGETEPLHHPHRRTEISEPGLGGQSQSAGWLEGLHQVSGCTPSSSPILRIAPLAQAGSANASNAILVARSRSPSGYFLKSHDSDPSVSSLPPSNPGRFICMQPLEGPPGHGPSSPLSGRAPAPPHRSSTYLLKLWPRSPGAAKTVFVRRSPARQREGRAGIEGLAPQQDAVPGGQHRRALANVVHSRHIRLQFHH